VVFMSVLCPPRSTLFPYTTLFRSQGQRVLEEALGLARELRPGVQVEGAIALQDPHTALLHKAGPKDLVVVGSRGLGPWRSALERSEEHTSELQSRFDLVCRLLLEK